MSQSRPAAPEPTEIAGRYQVLHKLGAGAFGTVYKARDKILDRLVAIKTIRLEGLAAASTNLDELLDRFKVEAKAAAKLKHPNILTIYDFGDADGLSYLAMEFIDGVGLEKVIAQGQLGVERAASIGAQVSEALDFAHKQNVVHRDIKPANIMLEAGDRVKVTDFGIAKVTDSAEHLTVTGSLLGTPSYMSPEQAKGTQLDGRSDLFAVGCVLYEMLAGKKAFRGDSITALIFKIITEEPPPIRELAADVPEAMVRIIAKALAKNRDVRYQTGHALAEDLLALTKAGSLPTVRQVEIETAAMTASSLPAPTLSATTPTLETPLTQAKPAARTLVSPRPPAPRPIERRSGGGTGLLLGLGVGGLLVVGLAGFAAWSLFLRQPAPETTPAPPPVSAAVVTERTAAPSLAAPPPPAPSSAPLSAVPTPAPTVAADRPVARQPAPPPPVAATPAPVAQAPAAAASFLDEEPAAPVDGRQAGEDLASKYRSGQGGGGSYGTGARFRQRPRSPLQLAPLERPAVATLRHTLDAEEMFSRKQGRYGTFAEMASAQTLFLDVAHQASSFRRAGYRFELTLTDAGFKVLALPLAPGPRPFRGDDSGFIQAGLD